MSMLVLLTTKTDLLRAFFLPAPHRQAAQDDDTTDTGRCGSGLVEESPFHNSAVMQDES